MERVGFGRGKNIGGNFWAGLIISESNGATEIAFQRNIWV
jgi:hypothetical protein